MKKILEKFVSLNVRLTRFCDRKFPRFVRFDSHINKMMSLIDHFIEEKGFCRVLEAGGIDRPLLKRSEKIEYDGLDVENNNKCNELYDHFFMQSIEEPIPKNYDLIISASLLEHVNNNTSSLTEMYNALAPGGCIVHYIPSKYHPYSLILRSTGPEIQKKLINTFRPWAKHITGYHAYFDKCSPQEMKELSRTSGFDNIEIIPFFRANDYFRFFIPAYLLVTFWENICRRFKWVQLCSGFILIARKQ